MRLLVLMPLLIFALAAIAEDNRGPDWVPDLIAAEEAAEGFFPLFNGKDFDNWWINGKNKNAFKVENGRLVVTGEDDGGWIFYDHEFENFVLRLDYRCLGDPGNSGISIRTPRNGHPSSQGFEVQVIKPDYPSPHQSAGSLYRVKAPEVSGADNPFGEWNSIEVAAYGKKIRTALNGQILYDFDAYQFTPDNVTEDWQRITFKRPMTGYIGFQEHRNHVEFRNVRIRPLPGGKDWRPLFNGKDLSGWEVVRDPVWSVTEEGYLRADTSENWNEGRCALRTVEEFDDFELRVIARLGDGANSGVFFRCSGDDPWPRTYEAQLDNNEPGQFTGSIWQQATASELRAMDNAWLTMHVTAKGPRIKVAVNGKTVVDYESERHEQFPKGWLALQAHHEDMIVDFKSIEIRELN
jgi:hypothetical protein